MFSTLPIPIAPAEDGDCDMMKLCAGVTTSLVCQDESLKVTVSPGTDLSGEQGRNSWQKQIKGAVQE